MNMVFRAIRQLFGGANGCQGNCEQGRRACDCSLGLRTWQYAPPKEVGTYLVNIATVSTGAPINIELRYVAFWDGVRWSKPVIDHRGLTRACTTEFLPEGKRLWWSTP